MTTATPMTPPLPSSAPSPSLVRALRIKYTLFFATGTAALFAFPPSLEELTTRTYVIGWISVLIIGSAMALAGSYRSVTVEAIGCTLEALALASYSVAFFAQALFSDRLVLFIVLALASATWVVMPTWRGGDLWIYIRTRRKLRRQGLLPR